MFSYILVRTVKLVVVFLNTSFLKYHTHSQQLLVWTVVNGVCSPGSRHDMSLGLKLWADRGQ